MFSQQTHKCRGTCEHLLCTAPPSGSPGAGRGGRLPRSPGQGQNPRAVWTAGALPRSPQRPAAPSTRDNRQCAPSPHPEEGEERPGPPPPSAPPAPPRGGAALTVPPSAYCGCRDPIWPQAMRTAGPSVSRTHFTRQRASVADASAVGGLVRGLRILRWGRSPQDPPGLSPAASWALPSSPHGHQGAAAARWSQVRAVCSLRQQGQPRCWKGPAALPRLTRLGAAPASEVTEAPGPRRRRPTRQCAWAQ